MQNWGIIYQYDPANPTGVMAVITPVPKYRFFPARHRYAQALAGRRTRTMGFALLAVALGGMVGPFIPTLRLESSYAVKQAAASAHASEMAAKPLPKSAPVIFNPLVAADGSVITPVNRDFSLVVPNIGINAPVIANVNPGDPEEYKAALLKGVAQASTSMLPDQNGTVYLFSHSTNYDWYVKDLNAVFYLLKNLKKGDLIVIIYKGKQYTYSVAETRIVAPTEISYLVPQSGKKSLILQTCWPPGSLSERLLVFADFVQEQ
jgi:LPXTG-site transpeptidase (sortase) family protein